MQLWVEGNLVGELAVPYPGRGQPTIALQVLDLDVEMCPPSAMPDPYEKTSTKTYCFDVQRRSLAVDNDLLEHDEQTLAYIYEDNKVGEANVSYAKDNFRHRTIIEWDVLTCDIDTYEAIFDENSFTPD